MLKASDGISLRIKRSLSNDEMRSLMTCYLPLIGQDGIILYASVMTIACSEQFSTHQPLLDHSDLTIDRLEQARMQCERAHLIRTFKKTVNGTDFYLWQVELPMLIDDFLVHEVLGRRLYSVIGKKRFDAIKQNYSKTVSDFSDFKAVSASLKADELIHWDKEFEQDFQLIKPKMQMANHLVIKFDTQKFLRDISPLAFPLSARTVENLRVIEECATIYGISEDDMRVLVSRSIRLKDQTLDTEKFKQKVRNFKGIDIHLPQDPYTATSIAFLQSKQNGVAVSAADKKLIEHLILDMKLAPEVVNVLLEYVLQNNQMRLSRSYVEKIAASWIRLNVTTKEEALAQTQREPVKGKSSRPDVLPSWYQQEEQAETDEPIDREKLIKKIKGGS